MKELELEALTDNLPRVLEFVDGLLEAADCPMKIQMQIDIAVEEIFVNIAHYAYADSGKTGSAVISAGTEDGVFTIVFRDRGVPYDPLAKADPDVTLPAEERPIGGLGIYMVKKSMDEVSYEYSGGENILTLKKGTVVG